MKKIPLLEFDGSIPAIIEPSKHIRNINAPERCVITFFQDELRELVKRYRAKVIYTIKSEIGRNPVYSISHKGVKIAVYHPFVGAPLAAGTMEEAIAIGCRRFIACGAAGTLHSSRQIGHVILVDSALRDEGASFHYAKPSRVIQADKKVVSAIERALKQKKIVYTKGMSWTTDGFYRETPKKIRARIKEGCLTVEMESAAFIAVARFRKVKFGQLLYAGDDVGGSEWNSRDWHNQPGHRRALLYLALDTVLKI